MRQIIFPPEIQAFETKLSSKTLKLLTKSIANFLKDKSELKLEDWYELVRELQVQHKVDSPSLWALTAKLAWILTDLEFFASHHSLLKKFKNAPLLTCYIGLGLAEFFDFERGLTLLEKGFEEIKIAMDKDAIIDIITPYSLIMNNSDNHEKLTSEYNEIQDLLKIGSADPITQYPYLIPVYLFVNKKKKKFDYKKQNELLSSIIKTGNNLDCALTYTLLSSDEDEASHLHKAMSSFKHLSAISAKNRLIISYTNYANYLGSKAGIGGAQEYFTKAINLANNLTLDQEQPGPLAVYPLSQQAQMQIECGELDNAGQTFSKLLAVAKVFNNNLYQARAEFGLAYIAFLLMDNDSALTYANRGLAITNKSLNYKLKCHYELKYAEILLDLNKQDEAEIFISQLAERKFSDCAVLYYQYIKGKLELNRHNIGLAKNILESVLLNSDVCKEIRSSVLFALTEGYLYEYRISEDLGILSTAQKTIEDGIHTITDAPRVAKGKWLTSILLMAQGKMYEAEDLLIELTSEKKAKVPRILKLAEELLDRIRQRRIESVDVSPISNIKDVVRYLRDAKSFIELDSR
ncbi:hypothetical protein CEE45_06855 [Candidatus Heimdallarchaeota archaeon B3_Heim]|nr:MAG: hypothetical protein CEE45_06855 [Candidatus Heimdallarchaeota archaeon B3_Heim]